MLQGFGPRRNFVPHCLRLMEPSTYLVLEAHGHVRVAFWAAPGRSCLEPHPTRAGPCPPGQIASPAF